MVDIIGPAALAIIAVFGTLFLSFCCPRCCPSRPYEEDDDDMENE